MSRNGWRIERLEGRSLGTQSEVEIEARALALVNRWNSAFAADGGDRAVAIEHDRHARSVGASSDDVLLNREWRAAVSCVSGWTFEKKPGDEKRTPVRFNAANFDALKLMHEIAAEAATWKIASGHDETCLSCRESMRKTKARFARG